jgi:hypothetical protein
MSTYCSPFALQSQIARNTYCSPFALQSQIARNTYYSPFALQSQIAMNSYCSTFLLHVTCIFFPRSRVNSIAVHLQVMDRFVLTSFAKVMTLDYTLQLHVLTSNYQKYLYVCQSNLLDIN